VELFGFVMGFCNKIIATSVTTGVFFGVSVSDMKGLMDITLEMNEKTESN
jgi:hypothetical protein